MNRGNTPNVGSSVVAMSNSHTFILHVDRRGPRTIGPLTSIRRRIGTLIRRGGTRRRTGISTRGLLISLGTNGNTRTVRTTNLGFNRPGALDHSNHSPVDRTTFTLPLPTGSGPDCNVTASVRNGIILLTLSRIGRNSVPRSRGGTVIRNVARGGTRVIFRTLVDGLHGRTGVGVNSTLRRRWS